MLHNNNDKDKTFYTLLHEMGNSTSSFYSNILAISDDKDKLRDYIKIHLPEYNWVSGDYYTRDNECFKFDYLTLDKTDIKVLPVGTL